MSRQKLQKMYGSEPRYNDTSIERYHFTAPLAYRYIGVPLYLAWKSRIDSRAFSIKLKTIKSGQEVSLTAVLIFCQLSCTRVMHFLSFEWFLRALFISNYFEMYNPFYFHAVVSLTTCP